MALAKLGEAPIQALNPNGSMAARFCYMHYHPTRREALCDKRWAFSVRNVTISAPDAFNGNMAHTLPLDCLRIWNSGKDWSLRGRTIYSNERVITLKYTADVEDVDMFSSTFVKAFVTLLALKLCIPLTQSVNIRQTLIGEYQAIIGK